MKDKRIVLVAVILAMAYMLILPLTSTLAAPTDTPITLNLNLGAEPYTLDPARADSSTSNSVVEQLFVGLVDMDDETAEIRPELATSWQLSAGGTVYTFALRSDVFWTDGRPVTAHDVRYGILRSLDPTTASDFAYVLFLIQNAEEYHKGASLKINDFSGHRQRGMLERPGRSGGTRLRDQLCLTQVDGFHLGLV